MFVCAGERALTHADVLKKRLHLALTDGEVSRAAIWEAASAAGDCPLPQPKGQIFMRKYFIHLNVFDRRSFIDRDCYNLSRLESIN